MIKKIFYGMFVMCMMLTYSCKDEDLAPIITFDQAGKGAYARLVELRTGEFDLNNLSSTAYDASVDFVDIDGGSTVTNYDIYVSYTDNSGNGLDKGEQLYKAYTAGDFGTSTKGNVGKDLNIPLSDLTSLLGLELSETELIAGNFFNVRTTITSDGVERGFSNSSSAVNGPAFQGHFNFSIKVTCPVADERFVGEYSMEYVETNGGGCFGDAFDAAPLPNVTLSTVPGSSTKRTMGVTYLPVFGGFAVTMEIDLVCTEIVSSDNDTGVGCSASIILGSGPNQPFDFNDDSEILFSFVEFAAGDCGCAATEYIMKLTKL